MSESYKWADVEIEIHHADCLDLMKNMPEETIDLTVTSPPYDDLRNYEGYSFDFETVASELLRITKPGGVVIWVVNDATVNGSETGTSFQQALYFKEIGFRLHDTMIYAKNNPLPSSGKRYSQSFEYIFCLSNGTPKTFNPITEKSKHSGKANMKNRGKDGNLEYVKRERTPFHKVGNIFHYSIGGGISTKDKIAFEHPAIFPEALVRDQIMTWSNKGDLVFDPFVGSGTVAKIAFLMERRFIGSEISQKYVDVAARRFRSCYDEKVMALKLFS